MRNLDLTDTIAAIATPVGDGGIGIVRLSGKCALTIADKIFVSKDGKKPSEFKTYTTHYGWIIAGPQSPVPSPQFKLEYLRSMPYPSTSSFAELRTLLRASALCPDIVDEVILTVMRQPRSYTKEDIVEINCHGGIVALRAILDLVLANGCRLASPGEFTKRAFLNGRIDFTQAEAVLDIIQAKTDSALKIGLQQLKGVLSTKINRIREDLLSILSILEASIDFPEEELTGPELSRVRESLAAVENKFKEILDTANRGKIMREGINVVICGKPNVGKSSLLNALLKQERSIVTPIAGTTRDTIEEIIDIQGIPIKIVDTAGILEPRDLIERKAVGRSKKYIENADLALVLFDSSRAMSKEDDILIAKLKKKAAIAIINKIDLKQKINRAKILKEFKHCVEISAKISKNIDILEAKIVNLVYQGKVSSSEAVFISNMRQIEALRQARKLVAEAANSVDNRLSAEFIAQGIKDGLIYIDELLGTKFSEDLLDKIFSEFCIGK